MKRVKIVRLQEAVTRLPRYLLVSSILWAAAYPVSLVSCDKWLWCTAESHHEPVVFEIASASSQRSPFEDDASSPSGRPASSQDAFARALLELGKIYERAGRLADAEATYIKALEAESDTTRQVALDSLNRVVHLRKESLWARAIQVIPAPLRTGLSTSLAAIVTLLLALIAGRGLLWGLRPLARWLGMGRLEVIPFADSTERKLASNFQGILSNMHAQMRIHYGRRGVMPGPVGVVLPVVVGGETVELTELVSGVADSATRAVTGLLRGLSRPEYSILGSIQGDGARINIVMSLEHMGRPLRTWDEVFVPDALFDTQKDLAYDVLLFLKRRMNP